MKKNLDIVLLAAISAMVAADLLTANEMVEALAFLFSSIGFLAAVMRYLKYRNDERIAYVSRFSAYMSFMLVFIFLMVMFSLLKTGHIELQSAVLAKYTAMMMSILYYAFHTIISRRA